MRRKSIISISLILLLAAALLASSCSKKPETLEEYAERNSEISEKLSEGKDSSDVKIAIKGNDIIYTYELSTIEGYNEDVVKNDAAVRALGDAIDKSGDSFRDICKSVQDTTELTGVRVTVEYCYKGKAVVTKTYTAE